MNNSRAITIKNQQMDVMTLGTALAKSGYFQDTREAAQAVVKILAGQELGIGPVASMVGIHIINGKPSYSANIMAAVVKNHQRYSYKVRKLDNAACSIEFFEGSESLGVSDFTMDDAKAAELTTGKNGHSWKKFPRNMLFARALSNGAKWYCPDAFSGVPPYTPDELDAEIDGETGEVIATPGAVDPDGEFIEIGPSQPDPSQWLPDLDEFKGQMTFDFGMSWDEVKALLKDLGFNGFKRETATEMYNAVAKFMADRKTLVPHQDGLFEDEPETETVTEGAYSE